MQAISESLHLIDAPRRRVSLLLIPVILLLHIRSQLKKKLWSVDRKNDSAGMLWGTTPGNQGFNESYWSIAK